MQRPILLIHSWIRRMALICPPFACAFDDLWLPGKVASFRCGSHELAPIYPDILILFIKRETDLNRFEQICDLSRFRANFALWRASGSFPNLERNSSESPQNLSSGSKVQILRSANFLQEVKEEWKLRETLACGLFKSVDLLTVKRMWTIKHWRKGASYLTKELSKELSEQNIESIRETWRNLVKLSLNFREKFQ